MTPITVSRVSTRSHTHLNTAEMRASERYIWRGIWRQLGSSTTRSQQRPLRGSAGVGRAYEGLSVGAKLDIMSDHNFWANLVDETNLHADQHLAAATYVVSPLLGDLDQKVD